MTHKLREVELVTDRVTVLRAGCVVGRHDGGDVSRDVLAGEMIGPGRVIAARCGEPRGEPRRRFGRAAGGATDACTTSTSTVRAGEVVGVAGVAGNGQEIWCAASPAC